MCPARMPPWLPAWMTQVEAWEAAAHPGVTSEVPFLSREFLEVEVPTTEQAGDKSDVPVKAHDAASAQTWGDSGVGVRVGGGERLVIYPARNGHASYHMPKRCVLSLRRSWFSSGVVH